MRRSNRVFWVGAIALGVIILLTLIAAPNTSKINTGSTYSRAPEGYGAWYAFMQQQDTSVLRWQKPFRDLLKVERPTTLLRVNSQLTLPELDNQEQEWVKKGNTLVILGVQGRVTEADFSTLQQSSVGKIKIDTRRRHLLAGKTKAQTQYITSLLSDRFGAVVWQEQIGKGRVIFSTTPYLAANAYQDYPSNYNYLAQLVSNSNSILVDEYIHGYKDSEVRETQAEQNWVSYLAQTPLLPVLLQGGILLLVLVWAQNRRFGLPQTIDTPIVDNSEAYIQALAGVLRKAESHDFVVDAIGKAELQQLQKALGLGQVDQQTLVNAWMQQTGQSSAELEQLLRLQSQNRRISDTELLTWLRKWQTIHSVLVEANNTGTLERGLSAVGSTKAS